MAKVRQRTWTIPGQRTKRKAWGYVTINERGKQVRCFKAEWTKEAAQDALAAYLLKIEQPRPAGTGLTFSQAAERYLATKARKLSLVEDQRTLAHLTSHFGQDTLLSDITGARISEYRGKRLRAVRTIGGQERVIGAAAINRPLALLRHLLRLAHEEWDALQTVPRIRLEKEPQCRLRWLTPEEAHRLLEACRSSKNAALVNLVELCLFTGLRQAEALGLTWDRVDRSRSVILLEVTKSGRRREVPLNSEADTALVRQGPLEAGLVFGTSSWYAFRKAWEAAVKAAKVPDFHFHDLRHTFASWAIQRGATLPELKDLLGHSSLAMVMRYAHLSPEHLRSAVSRLEGMLTPADPAVPEIDLVPEHAANHSSDHT